MQTKEYLLQNAKQSLQLAQSLCASALIKISEARVMLIENDKCSRKVHFQLDCILQQHTFLQNHILKLKIGDQLINKEWKADFFNNVSKNLEKWQSQLQLKFEKLLATPYDIDNTHDSLADFIDGNSLVSVQQRIEEFAVMQEEIIKIEKLYQSLVTKLQAKLTERKIKKLVIKTATKYGDEDRAKCEAFEEELNNLEMDLTNILNSVTQHFDKCQLLAQEYNDELLKIVLDDDLKIDEILDSLQEILIDATEVSNAVVEYFTLQEQSMSLPSLKTLIKGVIDEFIKLETQLDVFEKVRQVVATYTETAIKDIEGIKLLCDNYDNYLKSYYNLSQEITRRRKVRSEMELILKETQERLEKLQNQDLNKRERFLKENGDNLPQGIWEPQINSFEPLFTLDYSMRNI